MFAITKITANKDNTRLVFIASAPDTALGIPGAMKDIIATVPLSTANASELVPTLNKDDFELINVDGGFGEVKRK